MPLDPIFRDELIKFLGSSSLFPKRFKDASPPKLISQYFEENPRSLISKENFDILKDKLRFSIADINLIAHFEKHFLPTIEAIIANRNQLRDLMDFGFSAQNISSITKVKTDLGAKEAAEDLDVNLDEQILFFDANEMGAANIRDKRKAPDDDFYNSFPHEAIPFMEHELPALNFMVKGAVEVEFLEGAQDPTSSPHAVLHSNLINCTKEIDRD